MVPQIAMTLVTTSTNASNGRHRPVSAICAAIGPITQIVMAAKEPRKAIMELKFGTRIDTLTDSTGRRIRSTTMKICFIVLFDASDGNSSWTESFLDSVDTESGLGSSPKKFSIMTLI